MGEPMKILLALALLQAPAWGADDKPDDSTQQIKTTESKFTEAQAAQPQEDRAQKSKAASKAAAAGAALGKVQCMMMMDKARKAQDSGDSALLMMMANQQCQQADQLQKSSEENDKGSKSVSAADIPKQAKFEAGKAELEKSDVKEERIAFDEQATNPRKALSAGDISVPDVTAPAFNTPSAAANETENQSGVTGTPTGNVTTLNPIEKNALGYEDTSKNNVSGLTPSGLGLGLPNANAVPKQDGVATTADTSGGQAVPKRRGASSEEGTVAGGGGEEAPAPTGDPAMDALMAQLMGGSPEDLDFGMSPGALEVGSAPGAESPQANIFEYASIRYMRLHHDAKRLGKDAKQPDRALSSAGM